MKGDSDPWRAAVVGRLILLGCYRKELGQDAAAAVAELLARERGAALDTGKNPGARQLKASGAAEVAKLLEETAPRDWTPQQCADAALALALRLQHRLAASPAPIPAEPAA